jgi:hypothetical protein
VCERFTSLHFNSAFRQNQQFATDTFIATVKELSNHRRPLRADEPRSQQMIPR